VSPALIVTILLGMMSRTRTRRMIGVYSMATERRKHGEEPPGRSSRRKSESEAGRLPAVPELIRRALSMGLSGFFLTEEAIRKALGDAVPRDWTDFVVSQSDRTRKEFLERLSYEIGQSLQNVDLARVLTDLLEGRTLEVKAEIRLGPRGSEPATRRLHVAASTRKDEA
jgi:hypothetical protein